MGKRATVVKETAESMARRQREISVSEFFLKNRHLLGFDSPRRALMTAVKEAVDNSLDACEEAGILPEISVQLEQTGDNRFRVTITDNGPGILKAQIPKIFAKLLYGSKFHRLRMSRGQQGIGISAAGMYGQLTTGNATIIRSRTKRSSAAHQMTVQIDTRINKPTILKDVMIDWQPEYLPVDDEGIEKNSVTYKHGTSVSIEMEAAYVRGKLSVDEFLKQCAIVNPHLSLHYEVILLKPSKGEEDTERFRQSYIRAIKTLPPESDEIMPHPHGVELGMLMQMLKDTDSRTVRSALSTDFSRVSTKTSLEICENAGVNPKTNPRRLGPQDVEAIYKTIQKTKLMRPPVDCLAPIGEDEIIAGLKKEIDADFFTAVTRGPTVYRGNPFQIEVGMAYAKPQANEDLGGDTPVRVMRFANRVPLLYMAGACSMTRAMIGVNWKAYGLNQPRGSLPQGPLVVMIHMASVWVPFTSESKDAIANYQEIIQETTLALQECGRRLSISINKRKREAEAERKKSYIELYIPHLAIGLKELLDLNDRQENKVVGDLKKMLEKTHLEV